MQILKLSVLVLGVILLATGLYRSTSAKDANMEESNNKLQKAMFAAGCFWKVQYVFGKVPGVVSTAVGYSGGNTTNPNYKQVCSDTTGHAEVVLVEYDPAQVSYDKLLHVFWEMHDPTTLNRQGPDIGSQYRSSVFYMDDKQRAEAEAVKDSLQKSGKFVRPIATEIKPAGTFYKAEDYHQNYFEKHGQVCH